MFDAKKINRLEVIEKGCGRVVVYDPRIVKVSFEFSIQDDGKTLKIFVERDLKNVQQK